MKSLNANVRDADLSSTDKHIFPWKWNLSDLKSVHKNGRTVFTCFSCGGGSSMGYKLAGYTVLGNCEIDPKMMEVYKTNHHPKYSYLMDIRDFVKLPDTEIPEELKNLDILEALQDRIDIYLMDETHAAQAYRVLIYSLEYLEKSKRMITNREEKAKYLQAEKRTKDIVHQLRKRKLTNIQRTSLVFLELAPCLVFAVGMKFRGLLERFI